MGPREQVTTNTQAEQQQTRLRRCCRESNYADFGDLITQSGSFSGARTLGRPASGRDDVGLSLVARLSGFIPDGAGIASGLPSPPIGETFTLVVSFNQFERIG